MSMWQMVAIAAAIIGVTYLSLHPISHTPAQTNDELDHALEELNQFFGFETTPTKPPKNFIEPPKDFLESTVTYRYEHAPSDITVQRLAKSLARNQQDNGSYPEILGWTRDDNVYTLHALLKKDHYKFVFTHRLDRPSEGKKSYLEGGVAELYFMVYENAR